MTINYELYIHGEESAEESSVSLTAHTDRGALQQARAYAAANQCQVYLRWHRSSDGCVGYLDADGNAGPVGTLIGARVRRETPAPTQDDNDYPTKPQGDRS